MKTKPFTIVCYVVALTLIVSGFYPHIDVVKLLGGLVAWWMPTPVLYVRSR
jgi:hypothetical protein